MTRIRDLSIDEKPKERLIQFGSQALSNTELLAILINTGSRGQSSIDIASNIGCIFLTVGEVFTDRYFNF